MQEGLCSYFEKYGKGSDACQEGNENFIRKKGRGCRNGGYAAECSPDEYAADRLSGGTETVAQETVYQFDPQGRKGFEATKENIFKAKERFKKERTTDPLKKQTEKRTAQQDGESDHVGIVEKVEDGIVDIGAIKWHNE